MTGGQSATTVRGVVWDIGNVIVRWDPRTLYSKIFPDPAERDDFLARVCTLDWHLETDRGLPPAENTRRLIERFPPAGLPSLFEAPYVT